MPAEKALYKLFIMIVIVIIIIIITIIIISLSSLLLLDLFDTVRTIKYWFRSGAPVSISAEWNYFRKTYTRYFTFSSYRPYPYKLFIN